jgi:hypothetical protein
MSQQSRWRTWRVLVAIEKAALGAARWFGTTFNARDALFFGGLLVAGYGGAMLSLPKTLVVIGTVLTVKGYGPLIIIRRSES